MFNFLTQTERACRMGEKGSWRLGLKQFPARTTNSKQIFVFSKYNKFDYPARGGKITPCALPLPRSILIKTQK
jgi:hypothetical protein